MTWFEQLLNPNLKFLKYNLISMQLLKPKAKLNIPYNELLSVSIKEEVESTIERKSQTMQSANGNDYFV